ncbi:MAG: 16S rRNA (cytosine(967)-C(5))-methyltransferase RsmB [Reinekea sp.]|jgi:16S rRNA (cytosine967-C5)-methyltransferase
MKNTRLLAAEILLNVVDNGRSLNDELPRASEQVDPDQQAFLHQLVYGSTRFYFALDELIQGIVEKPIKGKERLVHMLLAIGLYQLWKLDVADHAAINETVDATVGAKKQWARNLVNASLRRFQRERESLLAVMRRQESFPGWLNKRLRQAYPQHYADICAQSNIPGPMTLRVNTRQNSRSDWMANAQQEGFELLATDHSAVGLTLASPAPVHALPGFERGLVSVQDEAAQMCAQILKVQDGERVLDACAAPGGKTGHLLEYADIELTALDVDQKRLQRVAENLNRIGLSADLRVADAADLSSWWQDEPYDVILLDAPCSGTGVIRRHPDIKLLRKSADIKQLGQVQKALLDQLWKTLKPGGRLLYATCSVLPDENTDQISAFLQRTQNAELVPMALSSDVDVPCGVQWLPKQSSHDGFYFALLKKQS